MVWYNSVAITGDRATQECDPSTVEVPYGIGLVSSLVPTLYEYAGGFNAINSGLVRGCFGASIYQLFPSRAINI